MNPHFVILAAGMGTRLGKPHPKCLTVLDNGETIMGRQIRNIRAAFGMDAQITAVVGYKAEQIVETVADVDFIYNEIYDVTNTSKSLLRAFRNVPYDNGIVWMNGDVVFDDDMLCFFKNSVQANYESLISVSTVKVSDEEVKYSLDVDGSVAELSKAVPLSRALGESIGVNFVTQNDIRSLTYWLNEVDDQDYFEKGIELQIRNNKTVWLPFNITQLGLAAVEVDFADDLTQANLKMIRN